MTSWSVFAAMMLVALPSARADAGQAQPDWPVTLSVALRAVYSDDALGASAGDSGRSTLGGFVWAGEDLCTLSAGGRAPQYEPYVGWRIDGRVLQSAGDGGYSVEISWQRIWDRAASATGHRASMQVVLYPDAPLLLDEVVPGASGDCAVVGGSLEARLTHAGTQPRTSTTPILPFIGTMDGRSVMGFRSSGSGTSGGGRGGLRGGRARSGDTPTTATTTTGRAAPSAVAPNEIPSAFLGLVDSAEIWLVHTLPNGTERVQRQTVALVAARNPFIFPPLRLTVDGESLQVGIHGFILFEAATASEPKRARIAIVRDVVDAAGRSKALGGAIKTVETLEPNVVTSYEVPVQSVNRDQGHTFAVRLRLGMGLLPAGGGR